MSAIPAALEMPVTEAYDWLFLQHKKREMEMKWEASLHGANVKTSGDSSSRVRDINMRTFMGMVSGPVERVIVSKEELARRQKMIEGK